MQQTSRKSLVSSSHTQIVTSVEVTLILIPVHSISKLTRICIITYRSLELWEILKKFLLPLIITPVIGKTRGICFSCLISESRSHLSFGYKGPKYPNLRCTVIFIMFKPHFSQNALGMKILRRKKELLSNIIHLKECECMIF